MKTYEIIVSGRVQGVGYRMYSKNIADSLEVKGSVKNQLDGNVIIVAQADSEIIEKFIQKISIAQHSFMKINHVEKKMIETSSNFDSFKILY